MNVFKFAAAMLIFGTIGLFTKYIPMPSCVLALCRGLIGSIFLVVCSLVQNEHISFNAIKKNIFLLIFSGAALGFNWIFLFEAYRYTTIATATLCYYLAPVFVILISPVLFNEKLTLAKIITIILAIIGMIFVSGVLTGNGVIGAKGIFFGILAALLYSAVIILNKFFKNISSYDTTVFQLMFAVIVLIPYSLMTQSFSQIHINSTILLGVIIVGVIHTGIAYLLYFSSIPKMSSNNIAILSYIDPITAIILSSVILGEPMGLYGIIGSILILGSTALNIICNQQKQK